VLEEVRERKRQHSIDFPLRPFKFQHHAYELLLEKAFPDRIAATLRRRFSKLSPFEVEVLTPGFFDELRTFSCSLPAALAQQLLRGWSGGWVTRCRMHEDGPRTCLFGCPVALDNFKHYSVCPGWRVITRKFDGVSVVESPLAFVAAVRRDLFTACRFVSVSNAYHHARAFRVGEIENLIDEGREEDLSALWQSLVKQFFIQTASRPDVPSTIFSSQFVNSGSSLPVPVQLFPQ